MTSSLGSNTDASAAAHDVVGASGSAGSRGSSHHGLVKGVAKALSFAIDDPSGGGGGGGSGVQADAAAAGAAKLQQGKKKWPLAGAFFEVFDSSAIPPIGIDKYLGRLAVTFRCSEASFVAALIIIERLLASDLGYFQLTKRNVHRLFLASLVVAVKFHEDLVYANSHYAKAGGVHLREVNRMERVLLAALDFDLSIHPDQYRLYEVMLLHSDVASLDTALAHAGYLASMHQQQQQQQQPQQCLTEAAQAAVLPSATPSSHGAVPTTAPPQRTAAPAAAEILPESDTAA